MANTNFNLNEILILLGAGASVEAEIPDSKEMVRRVEEKITGEDETWNRYKDLYWYIQSSVSYAYGLQGLTGDAVPFNIERLVNVLDELVDIKKGRHTLYPFVGAWNPRLIEMAGEGFRNVCRFREAILDVLRNDWLTLPNKDTASYYSGLLRFQEQYEYPLRVFSLNYDLCVEQTCGIEKVERGFDHREWDWKIFDEITDATKSLLLYKLHGSVDWFFTEDRRVSYSDSPSSIQDNKLALIFGTADKLQYIDPFLFLAYELRKWSLDAARAIICIGYGFNDGHINGILGQSLRQDRKRRLLAVLGREEDQTRKNNEYKRIKDLLDTDENQFQVEFCGAEQFLRERLTTEFLSELFPPTENLFPEMRHDDSRS